MVLPSNDANSTKKKVADLDKISSILMPDSFALSPAEANKIRPNSLMNNNLMSS